MKKNISMVLTLGVMLLSSLTVAVAIPCACGPEIPKPQSSVGGLAFAAFGNGASFSWSSYVPPVVTITQNGTSTTVQTTPGYFKNQNNTGKFLFNTNMTIGSKLNPDLSNLQKILVAEKYLNQSDVQNIFDAKMRDAVEKFQKANGIKPAPQYPYGYFGPITRGFLNNR